MSFKGHAKGGTAGILDSCCIVDTLAWKDDLVKHDELFVAILAGCILNILVLVVEHEADPLLDGIPEYLTSDTPVLCLVVALALKLFVVSSFVEIRCFDALALVGRRWRDDWIQAQIPINVDMNLQSHFVSIAVTFAAPALIVANALN